MMRRKLTDPQKQRVKSLIERITDNQSFSEIGSITGIHPTTLSKWLDGKFDGISQNTLDKLADYFSVSTKNLSRWIETGKGSVDNLPKVYRITVEADSLTKLENLLIRQGYVIL